MDNTGFNRTRDRSFRSRAKKLEDTTNELSVRCNARAAVIAFSPDDGRVVTHASPSVENVLETLGYEPKIPDALQRLGVTLAEVTASVGQMNANQLKEFHDLMADLLGEVREAQKNLVP